MSDDVLERWLEAVLDAPGATALADPESARRMLLDDALRSADIVAGNDGPVVDIGSGGGSPGIPLAAALPGREFTLLEAERRKTAFLEGFASELPNVRVVWGRAEEQPIETYGVALAKALAKPPVAVELGLPLVRGGGVLVLWLGTSADRLEVARVAEALAGRLEQESDGLVVLRKIGPTPAGFPRRPGMAKKRPLTG
jgi:16S rRNA (guanine527-N7)-methyltransferase